MDPFAKALQSQSKNRSVKKTNNLSPEIEKNLSSASTTNFHLENPLAQAMAKTGGARTAESSSPQDLEKQRKQLEKEQKKRALHLKLHKEVTGATDIFSTEKVKTQKKLEEIRRSIELEFRGLGKEISQLHKETSTTTFQTITDQGLAGTGMLSYLEKIRQFIRLLTKKIHSAKTWFHTQNTKSRKRRARRRGGAGIEVRGDKYEQSKAVFDQMHHEQATAYSGA